MTISFSDFVSLLSDSPALFITTISIFGVMLVNGWTDAPNSITACITTRALEEEKAIYMAVFLNFLGVFFITMVDARVAYAIFNIVDFNIDTGYALVALSASQLAVVLWAVATWNFGIPTSESHALIAGLTGSSIALNQGLSGINYFEWGKILFGMLGSTLLGVLIGYGLTMFINYYFFHRDRRELNSFFSKGQIIGSASMAFLHGTQSGQKFMGVFLLALTLASREVGTNHVVIPVWMMLMTSFVIAYGTSLGGHKIIHSVGEEMVKMKKQEGFASDIGSSVVILLSTMMGIPVSTTHIKMSSFVGVGMSRRLSNINWNIVRRIFFAWILTFPGCGLIAYFMTNIFMFIF